jgi:hypothetical protein
MESKTIPPAAARESNTRPQHLQWKVKPGPNPAMESKTIPPAAARESNTMSQQVQSKVKPRPQQLLLLQGKVKQCPQQLQNKVKPNPQQDLEKSATNPSSNCWRSNTLAL